MKQAKFRHIPPLKIGRKGQWTLTDHLIYYSAIANETIIVPANFETDLASIPRIFTPIHPKNGNHRPAAIVHDWLCRLKGYNRKLADKIFNEAMKLLDVPKWRRWTMYAGVRIGAFFSKKRRSK